MAESHCRLVGGGEPRVAKVGLLLEEKLLLGGQLQTTQLAVASQLGSRHEQPVHPELAGSHQLLLLIQGVGVELCILVVRLDVIGVGLVVVMVARLIHGMRLLILSEYRLILWSNWLRRMMVLILLDSKIPI